MIYAMTVTNSKDESLRLELANPEPIGMYVDSISGIGPGDADIIMGDLASGDGAYYSFSRRDPREIQIVLGMMGTPLVEDARLACYKYFNLKKAVKLTFETDRRTLMIDGFVSKNDPDIFSEEEMIDIEVTCPEPWFHDAGSSVFAFEGIDAGFEFPFSNESLTKPRLEFGEVRPDTRSNLYYIGEVDTGVVMEIGFLGPVKGLNIVNTTTREQMRIDDEMIKKLLGTELNLGVDLKISTVTADKYAIAVYQGKEYNIVGALDRDADWFKISNGDNVFAFACDEGQEKVRLRFTYKNLYGGV